MTHASTTFRATVYSPAENISTVPATTAPLYNINRDGGGTAAERELRVRTDSSGRIASQASTTVENYYAVTLGFDWSRR